MRQTLFIESRRGLSMIHMRRMAIAAAAACWASAAAAVQTNPPTHNIVVTEVVRPEPAINPGVFAAVPPGAVTPATPPAAAPGEPTPPAVDPTTGIATPPADNPQPTTNDAASTSSRVPVDTGPTDIGGPGRTGGGSGIPWVPVGIVVGIVVGGVVLKRLWPDRDPIPIGPQVVVEPVLPDPEPAPQPPAPTVIVKSDLDRRADCVPVPDLTFTGPRTAIRARLEPGAASWPE